MKALSKLRDILRLSVNRRKYDFANPVPAQSLNYREITSIVISKIDGKLGDTQVISPFFAALKRDCPWIKLAVLTSSALAPFYRDFLKADLVLELPKRPAAAEIDAAVAKIGKCDLLVTLEAYFRFHDFYLIHKLRPTYVAGINPDVKSINIKLQNLDGHITGYFSYLLELGGVKDACQAYTLMAAEEGLARAKEFCKPGQIMLCPWGASKHKHLKDATIIACAKAITELTGAPLALMVPPDGTYLHELLAKNIAPERLVRLPRLSILDLPAIAACSNAAVSVDTAYVHLACAAKIRLFAIYNGNNQRLSALWAPLPGKEDAKTYAKPNRMIDELEFTDFREPLSAFLEQISAKEMGHA